MLRINRVLFIGLSASLALIAVLLLMQVSVLQANSAQAPAPTFRINEIMADNGQVIENPGSPGDYDDWIELYNGSSDPVDLIGYYLTDDLTDLTKHQITETLIVSPSSYLLLFADGNPELGAIHLDFKLKASGEAVGLVSPDGTTILDSVTFLTQTTDVSIGRDSAGDWITYTVPTPNRSNEGTPPVIESVVQAPTQPISSTPTSITATIISGDLQPLTATLMYRTDSGTWMALQMTETISDQYTSTIPAQNTGTLVDYYILATGSDLLTGTHPLAAPAAFEQYYVGYEAPTLIINEIVADNDSGLEDPDEPGSYPDWIEILNSGSTAIDLTGMQLTDDADDINQYLFPDGLILEAGELLILYADNDPEEGDRHLPFSLSKNGEYVGLYDSSGKASNLIDSVTFGPLGTDVAYFRCSDGDQTQMIWQTGAPSPGLSNYCHAIFLPLAR